MALRRVSRLLPRHSHRANRALLLWAGRSRTGDHRLWHVATHTRCRLDRWLGAGVESSDLRQQQGTKIKFFRLVSLRPMDQLSHRAWLSNFIPTVCNVCLSGSVSAWEHLDMDMDRNSFRDGVKCRERIAFHRSLSGKL